MFSRKLRTFIPLVEESKNSLERTPLFSCDNEKRMEGFSSYLKRLAYNRYHLRSRTLPDPQTVASLRIHCPLCGRIMFPMDSYPPLFSCQECEHE